MMPRRLNEHLSGGLAVGLQAYGLVLLVAESGQRLHAESGDWPVSLSLAVGLLLALSIQMSLARALARSGAAESVRDTFIALSICHLFAVMTPGAFWFHMGLVGWVVAFTAWLMASSRWLLLAPDRNERWTRASLVVLGVAFGSGFAKLGWRSASSLDVTLYGGVLVSLGVAWQLHTIVRRSPAPAARPAMMRWGDFLRDPRMVAHAALALCLGLASGSLLFGTASYGPIVQGIALALLGTRPLQNRIGPAATVRAVLYLAAVALGADLLVVGSGVLAPYALAATATTIYAGLHAGVYEPRVLLSVLDRQSVQNGGMLVGILGAGALAWSGLEPAQATAALAFILLAVPYFASFLAEDGPGTSRE